MATKAVITDIISCAAVIDPASGADATLITLAACFARTGLPEEYPRYDIIVLPTDSSAVVRQKMIDGLKVQISTEFGIMLADQDIILQTISTGLSTAASETRVDTFTTTGNGVIIDTSLRPLSVFSITVEGRSGTLTSWDVRLEGSLDGTNWTQILQHTQVTGDKQTVYSGSNKNPSLFIRSRCAGLVLGAATSIKVTILGVP